MATTERQVFDQAIIDLDRESFLSDILMTLSGVLQGMVGLDEASGFVSLVGMGVGDKLQEQYVQANAGAPLDRDTLVSALIDLKRRIGGDFYLVSADERRIVLGNRRCPFGESVRGREAMCMMTSNVFGRLVAESQGYGRITLPETIAAGHSGCRVVIDLQPEEGRSEGARRYYRSEDG